MRILRVQLSDFRGIEHADIALDPDGVTVVEGPNEVGKSSIAEAVGLMRRYQDHSRAKDVLDIQPAGADVGPQVEIEITTGPYHFVYRKRFVKRTRTELEIRTPRAEQLSGREAHDRVESIFDETLDPQLWDALQMVQGESFAQPALAKIAPLRTALARSEGGAQDAGGHQDLLDRIDAEYATYFTPTGRATGAYATAEATVEDLTERLAGLDARLAGVDERLARHEANVTRLAEIAENAERGAEDLEALRERKRHVERLRERLERACSEREAAQQRREAATAAVDARRELVGDLERRTSEYDEACTEVDHATARLDDLHNAIAAADDRANADEAAARTAEAEHKRAVDRLASVRDTRELRALSDRVARVESAQRDRDAAVARVRSHPVGGDALDELLDAQSALLAAEAAQEAAAARITVERLGQHTVEVDGAPLEARHDAPVRHETGVTVPGILALTVTPGRDPSELSDRITAAREVWEQALARHGVTDIDEARAAAARHRDACAQLDRAETALAQALGDDTLEALTVRAGVLAERLEPPETVDSAEATDSAEVAHDTTQTGDSDPIAEAEQAVAEAEQTVTAARGTADESRATARERDRSAAETRESLIRLQQKVDGARSEIDLATRRLATARAERGDATLGSDADEARVEVEELEAAHAAAAADLDDQRPADLQVLLDNELAKADRFASDRRAVEDEQQRILGQLADADREGIRDQRDLLAAELADAEHTLTRLRSRANAVHLLRETMNRHLTAAQERYVAPFARTVERLGRIVFSADFSVEVTPDLAIASRTQDGVTVPFGSLSGGAKEQLAVIGRLACAQLVSADEGAPVVLDDSLGFSDPERLARLAAVLNEVGQRAQIIILTCQPERFAGVGSATLVRMAGTGCPDPAATGAPAR